MEWNSCQARRVDLEMGAWPMIFFGPVVGRAPHFRARPKMFELLIPFSNAKISAQPSALSTSVSLLLSFARPITLVSAESFFCQRPNFFLSTNSRRKLFQKRKKATR